MVTIKKFIELDNKANGVKGLSFLEKSKKDLFNNLVDQFENAWLIFSKGVALTRKDKGEMLSSLEYVLLTSKPGEIGCPDDIKRRQSLMSYEQYNRFLLDACNWNGLVGQTGADEKKQRTLIYLKEKWSLHGQYSHYTHTALIEAARILVLLKAHLEEAFLELQEKQGEYPEYDFSIYRTYLVETFDCLNEHEISLTESMYARWELAQQKSNVGHHDLTAHLINEVAELGVRINPPLKLGWQNEPLHSTDFGKFYYYINLCNENNPSLEDKGLKTSRVSRLRHLINVFLQPTETERVVPLESNSTLTQREMNGRLFFLPSILEKFVPARQTWFSWLFKGRHFRYHFFQNKEMGDLFVKLNFIANQRGDEKTEKGIRALDELAKIQSSLKGFQENAEKVAKNRFNSFLNKETKQLLEKWKLFLLGQQRSVLEKQIEILQSLSVRPYEHLYFKPGLDNNKKQQMEQALVKSQEYFSMLPKCLLEGEKEPMRERLYNARAELIKTLANEIKYSKLDTCNIKLLEEINAGREIDSEGLAILLDYLEQKGWVDANPTDAICLDGLINSVQGKAVQTIGELHNQIELPLEREKLVYLKQLFLISKHLLSYKENAEVQKSVDLLLEKYRLSLLTKAIGSREGFVNGQGWFIELEKILETLLPVSLFHRLYELRAVREGLLKGNPVDLYLKEEDKLNVPYQGKMALLDESIEKVEVNNSFIEKSIEAVAKIKTLNKLAINSLASLLGSAKQIEQQEKVATERKHLKVSVQTPRNAGGG